MEFDDFLRSASLLFVLLNPFLMVVYLIDLIRDLDRGTFAKTLVRAAAVSTIVFALAALAGERLFLDLLQVRYASFLTFGGLVFLVLGVRMATHGPDALRELRGEPEHIAGSIAMPFMIGPGTVNASILAGVRLPAWQAVLAIAAGVGTAVITLIGLKIVHDHVRRAKEQLVERYITFVGRISALLVGSIAVEMLFSGVERWLDTR